MNETTRTNCRLRLCAAAALTGAIALVAACASNPPAPTSSLDAAKVAISNADKADAGQYASAELGEARQKLALADTAMSGKDGKSEKSMVTAGRLADEARVEAELASARSAAAKAAVVNTEMNRGADALTEEMQRAGEKQ
jgi:hypothetical protein